MRPRLSRISRADDALMCALTPALARVGLNLVGAAAPDAYDARVPAQYALRNLAPEARGVVVIGHGGGAFWSAYRAFCARNPGHEATADPVDGFTRAIVEAVARPIVGQAARFLYPFRFPDDPVSFMTLAECAGLGRRSLVGVLVHPTFGPWIALRAAIVLPAVVRAPRPADGFDPCPTCVERPCIAACPGGAVSERGWDVPRCGDHRARADDPCAPRCHARVACVIGREHRYPDDALVHHQTHARPALIR
jgi:hypothetical protein